MIQNRGKPEQKIFVLDSKYYQYGATKNPNHLPDSASVVKQLAYAEYIDNPKNKIKLPSDIQQNLDSQKIYNAFIMPAFVNESQNIGFVSADYALPQDSNLCEKTYHKIYGILLDVKTIMHRHLPHDSQIITELSEKICRCAEMQHHSSFSV